MGDRTVPWSDTDVCDSCGAVGAHDFMGDLLCPKCSSPPVMNDSEKNLLLEMRRIAASHRLNGERRTAWALESGAQKIERLLNRIASTAGEKS